MVEHGVDDGWRVARFNPTDVSAVDCEPIEVRYGPRLISRCMSDLAKDRIEYALRGHGIVGRKQREVARSQLIVRPFAICERRIGIRHTVSGDTIQSGRELID